MTKQEEIKDGMIKFIKNEVCYSRWKPSVLSDVLLRYIKSQGGVLKSTKALPNEIHTPDGNLCYFEELI